MITALSISTGGLGRMGNQMFTIAGCIGIAVKSGQPYGFPEWITKDNEIFGNKPDNINDYLVNPLPAIPEGMTFREYNYFWGYKNVILPSGNWTIDAHMQSDKFFRHCMPMIRDTFRFKDEPPFRNVVALHWRAGDYIDDENAHHPRCTDEYYKKAIALFPGETIIVFSDDFEAAKIKFEKFDVGLYHSNYINDFKNMKQCKHYICANSSFSLMAAILGEHPDKKIVCPSRWFGKSMPAEFTTDDIYPEGAIII
jgi:Glycosyl transferase family 11